jgi:bifunctional N-acetylglucosamine-1-phosphate-uridyltransferase/glucosamine-1-phosphate-acetyltransferase GlmU-like protein
MRPWTGVVLALTEPGSDGLRSRLSTYLHPLAGRPLAWHTVHALAALNPAPERICVVAGPELPPEIFQDIPSDVRVVTREQARRSETLRDAAPAMARVLVVDAAAPTIGPALQGLLDAGGELVLEGPEGSAVAARLTGEAVPGLVAAGGLEGAADELADIRRELVAVAGPVRDRAGLARAAGRVRDRLVEELMRGGVTFLLPSTVLVDVDVRIGRDTVVYPGVVLEGQTTVGEEVVIGPSCRVISSWIGRGAELKGFNYVSNTTVRNRAILESHVRRGFD